MRFIKAKKLLNFIEEQNPRLTEWELNVLKNVQMCINNDIRLSVYLMESLQNIHRKVVQKNFLIEII